MASEDADVIDICSDSDTDELMRTVRVRHGSTLILIDSDDDDVPTSPARPQVPASAPVKKEDSDRHATGRASGSGLQPAKTAPQGRQARLKKRGSADLGSSREDEADARDTDQGSSLGEAAAGVPRRRLSKRRSLALKGSVSDVDVEDSDTCDEDMAWGQRKQHEQKPAKRPKTGEPQPCKVTRTIGVVHHAHAGGCGFCAANLIVACETSVRMRACIKLKAWACPQERWAADIHIGLDSSLLAACIWLMSRCFPCGHVK